MNRMPNSKRVVLKILVAVYISLSAFRASAAFPQNKTNETDDLARQLIEKLSDADKKGVLVMDMESPAGQVGPFGAWVANQLALSLAAQGKTIEIVDRSKLSAALEAQLLSSPSQSDTNNAVAVGKSIGATTVVVGSYGAAENGIGVTLAAFRVSEFGVAQSTRFLIGMVFGKIPLSPEAGAHLIVPLDSLRPKDDVYRSGFGGVSIPSCLKCPLNVAMHVPDVDIQGMLLTHPKGANVRLQFIVTAEGRTRNITVVQPVGYGFDQQYVKMVENWEFKPAVDADNKPVGASYRFHSDLKFK